MTISQNYPNFLYNNIQDTTSNVEQEQPSTNVNTLFLDFKYLFDLMNEGNSTFEKSEFYADTNPTLFNEISSLNGYDPLLQELQDPQFEQETPIINNNGESRQYEERSCKIRKNQRRIKASGRKISSEKILQMINEKNQGASIRSIIKKFKVDKNTLYKYNIAVKKYSFGHLLNLEEKLKKIFQSHSNCSDSRERFQETLSIPATILSSSFTNGTFHCFNRKSEQPQNSLVLLNNQLTEFLSKKKCEIICQRTNGLSIKTICKNFKTSSATLYKYHILNKRKYTNRRFSVKNTFKAPDRLPGIETLKEFMIPASSYNLRQSTRNQKLYYKI